MIHPFMLRRECVVSGIGFHHAGLEPGDRGAVERLFLEGMLPVLVSTSTLAMGVNLPAHLVIVKSTSILDNNEYKEYSEAAVGKMECMNEHGVFGPPLILLIAI